MNDVPAPSCHTIFDVAGGEESLGVSVVVAVGACGALVVDMVLFVVVLRLWMCEVGGRSNKTM